MPTEDHSQTHDEHGIARALFVQARESERNAWIRHARGNNHAYAFGYGQAAKSVLEGLQPNHPYWDYVGVALVLLQRHRIELMLKLLATSLREASGSKDGWPRGHSLIGLWDTCEKGIHAVFSSWDKGPTKSIGRLIRELDAVDPYGMSFRYPFDRDGNDAPIPKDFGFDPYHFTKVSDELCNMIEGTTHEARREFEAQRELDDWLGSQ